jgi:hypothetical protein
MKVDRASLAFVVSLSFAALAASCGSDDSEPSGASGAPAVGGSGGAASGGTTASGGAPASGGSKASGGAATSGGSVTTGGTKSGAGGSPASGGKSGATGGSGGTAGSSGGTVASGGTSGSGAGAPASGGGGATSSGGSTASGGGGGAATGGTGGGSGAHAMMNFFVTSDTSKTADLGGLMGADERCQTLAAAVGHGSKTWRAYLSAEEPEVNARDRIGAGPYYNSKGEQLAADKDALHARTGDAELFLDEKGNRINGQWMSSPMPNQHDILTGSDPEGALVAGQTCDDWTGTTGNSAVGHSDGLGPSMNSDEPYSRWVGSHTGQCGNTEPGGGAGKIYCFVGP